MGIIKSIIKDIKMNSLLKRSIKEMQQKQAGYVNISSQQFAALPNNELFDAALARTEAIVSTEKDVAMGIAKLKGAAKAFYAVSYYDAEVNNGGLCQFFVNSSKTVAPFISSYLQEIGAAEHKKLFDDFVSDNDIDLNQLSSFTADNVDEYEKQTQRYPFENFDNAFYDAKPLADYLTAYINKHRSDF